MSLDHDSALLLLGLLVAVAAMLAIAPALRIPYPVLLVLGGLALGFVPGVPDLALPPQLVLVAVLPPLLYSAAYFTSLRELQANLRPISLLAFGLVLATTLAVAAVAHRFVGLSWSAAFVLGAIVAPTDPIAAITIARRLGAPRRIVTIVEGESLINDGTALVLYKFAVAAVTTGSLSLWHAGLSFIINVIGGVAVGLAVGYVVRQLRRRLDDPPVEITISLLTGYFAYLPAELIGVSGVLAVVTVGIYVGWYAPELSSPQQRLQGTAVWEIVAFLLNALLFLLVGLQFPVALSGVAGIPTTTFLRDAASVSGAVIVTRLLWIIVTEEIPSLRSRRRREWVPSAAWQERLAVSWMGMRGAVSLAMALALPSATDAGTPFKSRDLIVSLTFAVILATLVLQGLSLPLVLRALGLQGDDDSAEQEERARLHAASAALVRLEELLAEEWVPHDAAERIHDLYASRLDQLRSRAEGARSDDRSGAPATIGRRLRRELLAAERQAIVELHRSGEIDDEVMRRLLRELDLEEVRLQS
jgi:CPA1 family monovalent cation:H+ antiporter